VAEFPVEPERQAGCFAPVRDQRILQCDAGLLQMPGPRRHELHQKAAAAGVVKCVAVNVAGGRKHQASGGKLASGAAGELRQGPAEHEVERVQVVGMARDVEPRRMTGFGAVETGNLLFPHVILPEASRPVGILVVVLGPQMPELGRHVVPDGVRCRSARASRM